MGQASILLFAFLPIAFAAQTVDLPAHYFRLMEAGSAQVKARLEAEPAATLKSIEAQPNWRHFGYAILPPAVLYAKQHAANRHYRDRAMLELALRIGDLLATESENGTYEPRGDSDWDTYMWLEAYRLLEKELGEPRRARWRREIEKDIALYFEDATDRLDFPWYNSPYIGTSPNHYALWAANFYLGGRVFGRDDWVKLGRTILRRYALVEQTPDGYWGEHSRQGPTIGYNHLTLSALAVYREHSQDPDVLPALRRATDLHKYFTFLNGQPVDVMDDRNRYRDPMAWAQFAFTHFPDGRGYAAFLASFFKPDNLGIDRLGRLAQDALYYHPGPSEPAPQETKSYWRQLSVPAGIRKTGAWQVALAGFIDTQAINSNFYLDRQGNVSVFHEELGLIVSGANSKNQPELATFSEKLMGQLVHMPLSSRLQMSDAQDRLSLGFNTFFSDLYVPAPTERELHLRFVISGRGRPAEDSKLTLQLCLKGGEPLETGAGRKLAVGGEKIELGPADIGGWIRHHGWTMKVDPTARLVWPVYPHNPYGGGRESRLDRAVAALSVPLALKAGRKYVRAREQEIAFTLSTE
jgi:hypothetical protein